MIGQSRLVAFLASTDLDRARAFYVETLELTVRQERPHVLVLDCAGTELRVTAVPERPPTPYTVLGWQVADLDTTVRALSGRGVEFVRYEAMEHDDLGIWTAPDGTRIAWFTDPDANVLSLSQS